VYINKAIYQSKAIHEYFHCLEKYFYLVKVVLCTDNQNDGESFDTHTYLKIEALMINSDPNFKNKRPDLYKQHREFTE
jgi:hypothetical protein